MTPIVLPSTTIFAISEGLSKQKDALEVAKQEFERLTKECNDEASRNAERMVDVDRIHSWADVYASTEMDHKRTIVAELIDTILVYDVDNIQINFKLTAQQYLGKQQ